MTRTQKLCAVVQAAAMQLTARALGREAGTISLTARGADVDIDLRRDSARPHGLIEVLAINAAGLVAAESMGLAGHAEFVSLRRQLEAVAGEKFGQSMALARVTALPLIPKIRGEVARLMKQSLPRSGSTVALAAAAPPAPKLTHGILFKGRDGKARLASRKGTRGAMLFSDPDRARQVAGNAVARGVEAYPVKLRMEVYGDDGTAPAGAVAG